MSRAIPWRSKPTAAILQLLPRAKELRLYQVGEIGPTSFVFQDDSEAKFKVSAFLSQVSIGQELSCSCSGRNGDHCIHTLYVMLKKFKVDESHPILWQGGYLNSELDELLDGKYSQQRKRVQARPPIRSRITEKATEQDQFARVAEDDECPICAEVLNVECYSQCSQCRNCIHSRCLKIWTSHKMASRSPVTCPMCRAHFTRPLELVAADEQRWADRRLIHRNSRCAGCGNRNFKGNLYQCLNCSGARICGNCFQGPYHSEHNYYLVKELPESQWKPIQRRVGNQRPSALRRQLFDGGEQPAQKEQSIEAFALYSLPTIQTKLAQERGIGTLGIVGNELFNKTKEICQRCGEVGNDLMRRLECGHNVHDRCLLQMIAHKQLSCSVDGETVLKGYAAAFGIPIKARPRPGRESAQQFGSQASSLIKKPRLLSGSKPNNGLSERPLQLNVLSRPNLSSNMGQPAHNPKVFRIKKSTERRRQPQPPPSLPELQVVSFQQEPSRLIFHQHPI